MKQAYLMAAIATVGFATTPAWADFTFGNDARSVTVYGRIDLGVTDVNSGTAYLSQGGGSLIPGSSQIHPGADSWLGVNADMQLDYGLKSYIRVQQRFQAATGAELNSASEFYGWSYVGLQNPDFGAVELGRQYVPAGYIALNADPFRWDTVATISNLSFGATKNYNGYTATDGPRYKNGIYLKSASFNGFKGVLAYSFEQDNTEGLPATTSSAATPPKIGVGREVGGTLEYINGPLYAGLGYDETSSNASGTNASAGQNLSIGTVSYDFGVVKPVLSFTKTNVGVATGSLTTNVYSLGLTAPIGRGDFKAVAAQSDQSGPGSQNLTKFGVGYHYWLKRVKEASESYSTKVYIDFGSADGPNLTKTNAVDVGLMVSF